MKLNKFLTVSMVLLLGSCASEPTITSSTYAKEIPEGFTAVSICYSASDSTRAEVEAIALEECPTSANAVEPWDTDTILNDCPVLKTERITFLCVIK